MKVLTLALFIIIFVFTGCYDECYWNLYQNVTNYTASPNTSTPNGVVVDTNGFEVDLELIDWYVDNFEECFGIEIKRECFEVLIAPDWYTSPCSGQQMFPCGIDPQICLNKDLTQEDLDECPCACRSIIQDEHIIVTTPNLYLFQAELARMVTGQNNVWIVPEIVECMWYGN